MIEEAGDSNTPTGSSGPRAGGQRRLAAILAADVRGYSAMMEEDEEDTLRRVTAEIDRLTCEVEGSYGQVFSVAGDGLLAEFPSSVEALKCALRVQADAARRNTGLPPTRWIEYRIGINAGEIIVQNDRPGGNAINIATRLEQIAEPGSIAVSGTVFEQVSAIVVVGYDRLGEPALKNIRGAVPVYQISADACRAWMGMPVLPRLTARPVSQVTADSRASLAVLPFRTLQTDQADSYFAEGMIDDIIRLLGGLKELLVIARSSTVSLARSPLDLRRIGHDLDVRYVLHGSVHRSGEKLRIAVELSEVENGRMIWADRFDGKLGDLFELQDRIALRVLNAVAPQVRERELLRAMRKHPDSMTAYDLTLQALERLYTMQREPFVTAAELLRRAIGLDRRYTSAHAYLAFFHQQMVGQEWSTDVAADASAALDAAEAALQYDRHDAMALTMYGHTLSFIRKDFVTAKTFLDRAIIAGPSCAWAWSYNSFTCQFSGDTKNAVSRAEQAVRLSPIGPDAFWHEHALSQAHYFAGNFEEAVSWGRLSAAHNDRQTSNLRTLIASLVALGDIAQVPPFVERLLQVAPAFRLTRFAARTPLEGAGRETFVERLRRAGLPD